MISEILGWIRNLLRSWIISCVFAGLVGWERIRRYFIAIRHRAQRHIHSLLASDLDSDDSQPEILGRNAPSLDDSPAPMSRPLSQRITSAWIVGQELDIRPCTEELRKFMDNHNIWSDRSDIFYNQLSTFIPGDVADQRRLLVLFKNGMRKFSVVYKNAIVFPPAVSPKVGFKIDSEIANVQVDAKLFNNDSEHGHVGRLTITEVFKQLAGPAGDYYLGSCYESTVNDLAIAAWTILFFAEDSLAKLTDQFSDVEIIIMRNQSNLTTTSKVFDVKDTQSLYDLLFHVLLQNQSCELGDVEKK